MIAVNDPRSPPMFIGRGRHRHAQITLRQCTHRSMPGRGYRVRDQRNHVVARRLYRHRRTVQCSSARVGEAQTSPFTRVTAASIDTPVNHDRCCVLSVYGPPAVFRQVVSSWHQAHYHAATTPPVFDLGSRIKQSAHGCRRLSREDQYLSEALDAKARGAVIAWRENLIFEHASDTPPCPSPPAAATR